MRGPGRSGAPQGRFRECRAETWCATGTPDDAVATTWTRPEIEEHIRDEHSTFIWLLEPMIERCGFRLAECYRSTDGLFTKYIAVAV